MNTPSQTDIDHGQVAGPHEATCSAAVEQALALIEFGPCRSHPRPSEWFAVSAPMCAHCQGIESVDQAAGRIIAAEYRRLLKAQPPNDLAHGTAGGEKQTQTP